MPSLRELLMQMQGQEQLVPPTATRPRTVTPQAPVQQAPQQSVRPDQMSNDDLYRAQHRMQMDHRFGIDDVTVLPSGQRVRNTDLQLGRPSIGQPQAPAQQPSSMRDMLAQQPAQLPQMADPNAPLPPVDRGPFGSSGEVFGGGDSTRERRAGGGKFRDFVADDSAYLRDLEARPHNWKDKTVDVIRGLNAHFNPGSGPGMPTKRERNIEMAQGSIGRDLAVEKSQTDQALKSMVPVTLADGTVVMSPARGAGTLTSQQQRVKQQGEALESLKTRRKDMSTEQRGKLAVQILNTGSANDPKTLEALSEVLDLPATLTAKMSAGEVIPQVDDKGEVQLINKRTGKVEPTGVTSYETTKEAGRNTRQERSAAASMARTEKLIAAGIGKLGDPAVTESTAAELADQATEAEELAKELTDKGFPSQGAKALDRAVKLRGTITSLKEAANKARTAQKATPQRSVPRGTSAPATKGSFNMKGWIADHPDATEAQKKAMRAKAKARGFGIVE